ncbi:hypothetical protein [Melissococcus plutonius]|uniref:hypothetical protein n=1 Tax=Melissococcus plutonius TaxID=33970 RepID=UPI0021E587B0|nr:hypothetical protein [Melissococcus plutonius]MCV2499582.1 hypothetical protein [Melissococcus plutonius]MCV2501738.1 hypothetical protein [Melissococcus plutonius]MCV2505952.1 hypothetical protein [Melissococcus plutonius]MCV2508194.1 hypothetical protein [Melissococcus plutonius]MCV2528030.1 hypothetical protein [Melissococcus plutonius]
MRRLKSKIIAIIERFNLKNKRTKTKDKKLNYYETNFFFILFSYAFSLLALLAFLMICGFATWMLTFTGLNISKYESLDLEAWIAIIFCLCLDTFISIHWFKNPTFFFRILNLLVDECSTLDNELIQKLVDIVTICCTAMLFCNTVISNGSTHILFGYGIISTLLMSSYPVNLGLKILQFEEYNKRKFPKETTTNVPILSESESNKN